MIKLFLFLLLFTNYTYQEKTNTSAAYYARSSIVMEVYTNKILYSNNIYATRSVASVSKIMTAIIAIEEGDLEEIVTITDQIKKVVGSMIYVKVGDKLTLEELIYGLMLRSGNDAAVSIAIAVSGSIEEFVDKMNNKAHLLGMKSSYFRNPHGLDEFDGGNISNAYDLALLMSYSIKNAKFAQIAGSRSYHAKSINTIFNNKNRLLGQYKLTTGGKTGYTRIAKRTLVTSAKKDETELVVVTLDSGSDFALHKHLYETYFEKYKSKKLVDAGERFIANYLVKFDKDYRYFAEISFWNQARLSYEINQNQQEAEIVLNYQGQRIVVGKGQIIAQNQVKKQSWWQKVIGWFK